MQQTRTYNSVRNILWAIINKLAIIVMPFIVRTVMIYKLGAEYTGLSSLFTSVLTMLSLAELGFSNAMVYCMYEPIHNNDKQTICALMNFYKKIYRVIGTIVFVVGIVLLPFLSNFIKGSVPEEINIYLLYLIYLLNTAISYFLFAYKSSLLVAYQRNDVISVIGLICNLFMYFLQIIVLLTVKNFYLFALLLPLTTLIMNLSYEKKSNQICPDITCRGEISVELRKKKKKRVIGIMLYKISSTTRTSFDSIVISSFLGLVLLTQYQNYFMIISSVIGIFAVINNAITASVGDSIISKTKDENYRDFKKFVFIYIWFGGVCSILVLCLIQPFMRMWVGEKLMLDTFMVILFSVYFYVQTIGDVVFLYRTAAGLWWQDRIRPIVEAVSNILLNIILVNLWGIYGVILATIITLIGINFLWGAKILFKYYFDRSMGEYIKIQLRQAILTIIAATLSFGICSLVEENIVTFIVKIAIGIIVPSLIYYIFNYKSKIFIEAKEFVIKIIYMIRNKFSKKKEGV